MRWVLWLLAATGLGAAAAVPVDVSGRARVIDGDSIVVDGTEVRLHGIDAPESRQTCLSDGKRWPCGKRATQALASLLAGHPVDCSERDIDRYGRVVATCRRGNVQVNDWLVANGWALAYRRHSQAYVAAESAAKTARRGIWRGEFVAPWAWRDGKRLAAGDRCDIKGNISYNTGRRLYHLPGDPGYAATRIDTGRGERWFCSEREARAAGWRRARR